MTFLNYTWYYCLRNCVVFEYCVRDLNWEKFSIIDFLWFDHSKLYIMPIAYEYMNVSGVCMVKWLFLLQQIRPEFK